MLIINYSIKKILKISNEKVNVAAPLKNDDAYQSETIDLAQFCRSSSKVSERLSYPRIIGFADTFFFVPYLCGFRKGFNTQHALLRFIDACKNSRDKKVVVGN